MIKRGSAIGLCSRISDGFVDRSLRSVSSSARDLVNRPGSALTASRQRPTRAGANGLIPQLFLRLCPFRADGAMDRRTRYSPEVRERAVRMRMVFDHEGEYPSQWSAMVSISQKFGRTAETLRWWVRRAETDRGAYGDLLLAGRLVQPAPAPLGPRLLVTHQLREEDVIKSCLGPKP